MRSAGDECLWNMSAFGSLPDPAGWVLPTARVLPGRSGPEAIFSAGQRRAVGADLQGDLSRFVWNRSSSPSCGEGYQTFALSNYVCLSGLPSSHSTGSHSRLVQKLSDSHSGVSRKNSLRILVENMVIFVKIFLICVIFKQVSNLNA